MKILAHVHGYPPRHNSGAEWMLHSMLKHVQHECRVLTTFGGELDGVTIIKESSDEIRRQYHWADVVITHLDYSGRVQNLCRKYRKKLVWICHNSNMYSTYNRVIDRLQCKVVYNSQWLKDAMKYPHENIIVHPPVLREDYTTKTGRGKHYTLINLNDNKGGNVLREIAGLMPKSDFLGVKGAYGEQITDQPDNVKVIDTTDDIKAVYRKTRIVLMPSDYESWGRVAVEAAINGLPVIAHPTPGLKEALGDAGVFVDRNKPEEWVEAIKEVEKNYEKYAMQIMERGEELDQLSQEQIEAFELWLA